MEFHRLTWLNSRRCGLTTGKADHRHSDEMSSWPCPLDSILWFCFYVPSGGRMAVRSFRLTSFQIKDSRKNEVPFLQYFAKCLIMSHVFDFITWSFLYQSLWLKNWMLRLDRLESNTHPRSRCETLAEAHGLQSGQEWLHRAKSGYYQQTTGD